MTNGAAEGSGGITKMVRLNPNPRVGKGITPVFL